MKSVQPAGDKSPTAKSKKVSVEIPAEKETRGNGQAGGSLSK